MALNVTAAVMHAPWYAYRGAIVSALRKKIPGLHVVEDTERKGCWHTAKRAWSLGLELGGTHHLVLQDDVKLCASFWRHLPYVVSHAPRQAIYLYSCRQTVLRLSRENDCHWIRQWGALNAQAIVLPAPIIKDWLRWLDEEGNIPDDVMPDVDDSRLALYLMANDMESWITVPTLVDHVLPNASTLGHNNPDHVSCDFLADRKPGSVEWRKGLPSPPSAGGPLYKVYRKKCGLP